MLEFLYEYGLFLAKAATWVVAIGLVVAIVGGLVRQARHADHDHLDVRDLGERLRELADTLNDALLSDRERKQLEKQRKRDEKARAKAEKHGSAPRRPRIFVLDFDGDLRASEVENLREEITGVLQVSRDDDEVLLRLESEGGMVHGYGLAASQLARLKARGIRLTVAVDKVAASGGYMMACVADRVVAAPFSILGSIGVVAQLPNFNRLLRKHEVDYEMHTAGEFKRTLTLFGENTEEGRAKFREEIEETHGLFKAFVASHRPQLDLAVVATGEHWFGTRALELKLVDEIRTSDDYLLSRAEQADIYEVHFRKHRPLSEKLQNRLLRLMGQREPSALHLPVVRSLRAAYTGQPVSSGTLTP